MFWIIIIWAILSLWASRSPSIEMSWNNKQIKSWWARWLSVFLFPVPVFIALLIVMAIGFVIIMFILIAVSISIHF